MADLGKILGQLRPTPNSLEALYSVPAATSATISSLSVCNIGPGDNSFSVLLAQAGGTTEDKQYLYNELSLGVHDTFAATLGITLAATDVIRVQTGGTIAFQAFGFETT